MRTAGFIALATLGIASADQFTDRLPPEKVLFEYGLLAYNIGACDRWIPASEVSAFLRAM